MPQYLQLKQQIFQNEREAGYQLPTVRQMAVDISINVYTVSRVYQEVEKRVLFALNKEGEHLFAHRRIIMHARMLQLRNYLMKKHGG